MEELLFGYALLSNHSKNLVNVHCVEERRNIRDSLPVSVKGARESRTVKEGKYSLEV